MTFGLLSSKVKPFYVERALQSHLHRGILNGKLPIANFERFVFNRMTQLGGLSVSLWRAGVKVDCRKEQAPINQLAYEARVEVARIKKFLPKNERFSLSSSEEIQPSQVITDMNKRIATVIELSQPHIILGSLIPFFELDNELFRMMGIIDADHPYKEWLDSYPENTFSVSPLIEIADEITEKLDEAPKRFMIEAYVSGLQNGINFLEEMCPQDTSIDKVVEAPYDNVNEMSIRMC